jgi:putative endonuclease
LKEHNLGKNQSTKSKIPYVLVYHEAVDNRMKAREREKWFKSGEGREFLRKIILEK